MKVAIFALSDKKGVIVKYESMGDASREKVRTFVTLWYKGVNKTAIFCDKGRGGSESSEICVTSFMNDSIGFKQG